MKGRRYEGHRLEKPGPVQVERVEMNGKRTPLDPCFHLRNHSPEGFNWGYGGSGPAQLSLALAVDATGDPELGCQWYQSLKEALVGRINGERFELSAELIRQIIAFWDIWCPKDR